MRRIAILTAGGDTPALNATIYGAVSRANALRIEVYGVIKGFSGVLNPRLPHVHLNPLYMTIPELTPGLGGTILGASRDYVNPEDSGTLKQVAQRLTRMGIEGLICIGGDGTINGMQPLAEFIPTVLAPKTIDNDLGLNYAEEATEWLRETGANGRASYRKLQGRDQVSLDDLVNYATPGYATAVYVAASGIQRVRTTAESHRRIAIIEVMGRDSGYIALGSAYGQPDIILIPEAPLDEVALVDRVREVYDLQKHVVIVVGEGVRDASGQPLGTLSRSVDPAGNVIFSGAAEHLKQIIGDALGDHYFVSKRRNESANSAIFTRKLGHTQRGGRPILFDRFHAAQLGSKAVEVLAEGQTNMVVTLQWNRERGFYVDAIPAFRLRDQWGIIHPRQVHPSLYDAVRFQPSRLGVEFLMPIFTNAIGADDMEEVRAHLFHPGNLTNRFHSVNVDIQKRIRLLSPAASGESGA
jgi:ATP-dependent phosphofructokinase / diphosphate-dependent phosphofructokinase